MVRIHLASGERRTTGLVNVFAQDGWFSPSGRYSASGQMADFEYGSYLFPSLPDGVALDTADTIMALPQAPPGSEVAQIVLVAPGTRLVGDGDGLNDHWETAFGLDIRSAIGASGAAGDPDGASRSAPLFQQRFQLGDRVKVLRPAARFT